MRSTLLEATGPVQSAHRWARQDAQSLRVGLGPDVLAAKGAMTSHRGDLTFTAERTGSMAKLAKKVVTSENVALMRISGRGEAWLAQEAGYVHTLELEGEAVSINARNLLAFDATLAWDINRIKGAGVMAGNGLFNTTVHGTGTVAVAVLGHALVLDCSQQPVCTDPHATVLWSAGLAPSVRSSMNLGSMVRGGSGEVLQYVFHGPGFVVVQAREWLRPSQGGRKGLVGNALDLIP